MRLGLLLALVSVQASAAIQLGGAPADTCTVVAIHDGDTITCGTEKVRLLLIDAPELKQQPYGARSRAALLRILPLGTSAKLETDTRARDQYGRLLAYVWKGPKLVNEELARDGYVVPLVYRPNVRYLGRIQRASDIARTMHAGLWATKAWGCSPHDFRHRLCK